MRAAGIVVVACLVPLVAAADERRDVGEGYQVQIAADGLWVRKGDPTFVHVIKLGAPAAATPPAK